MAASRDQQVLDAVAGKRPGHSGWVRGNCPWCLMNAGKEDKKRALSLHVGTGKWHCFRCGTGGQLHESLRGALPALPSTAQEGAPAIEIDLPEGFYSLADPIARQSIALAPAFEYLRSRDVPAQVIRDLGIGACVRGHAAGRVVVPIRDIKGKLVGWVGRTWTKESDLKYLYAKGMNRGTMLFNPGALQVQTAMPALVVEGSFDTFPFWPHAVAVLGKVSQAQFELLCAAKRPLAVAFDGDAWREGAALALKLRMHGKRAGNLVLPPRIDPDELPVGDVLNYAVACLEPPIMAAQG